MKEKKQTVKMRRILAAVDGEVKYPGGGDERGCGVLCRILFCKQTEFLSLTGLVTVWISLIMACFFGSGRVGLAPPSWKRIYADSSRRTCLQRKDERHCEKSQRLPHGHDLP